MKVDNILASCWIAQTYRALALSKHLRYPSPSDAYKLTRLTLRQVKLREP